MVEYIDREMAIEICDWYEHRFAECEYAIRPIADDLKKLPVADVQPVRHGKWMLYENQNQDDVNNGNYLYVCSNCNYSDIHAKTVEVPFCWHCGARMEGEHDVQ